MTCHILMKNGEQSGFTVACGWLEDSSVLLVLCYVCMPVSPDGRLRRTAQETHFLRGRSVKFIFAGSVLT